MVSRLPMKRSLSLNSAHGRRNNMPGIYGMAVLTIGLTALLCMATLNHFTRSDHRYFWFVLAGLPLSFIVNQFIKTPAITSLAAWTGTPLRLASEAPVWFII